MTQAELDEWMTRITYKPGWTLRARLYDDTGIGVSLRGRAIIEITVGFHVLESGGD
jgi:hypothetical protein